jgi:hypothetical protein
LAILFFTLSCKTHPSSDRHYTDGDESKVYRLRLSPVPATRYHFDITNSSEVKIKVGEKQLDNLSRSTIGAVYKMDRDSAGHLLFSITYDKVHLLLKKDGTETEMDAANAAESYDPVEKMLGALQSARIEAVISPNGDVLSVTGYKELTDKMMVSFNYADEATRRTARSRLEQMVGDGIVKKNMDQLFKIFPDSAVHIGDRWKLSSQRKDEVNLHIKNTFQLKDIDDGVALITSEGEITSDSAVTQLSGYAVNASLKGLQKGEYEMQTATGMLVSANITANVEGTMQVMGRDIPVTIGMTVKMSGRPLK